MTTYTKKQALEKIAELAGAAPAAEYAQSDVYHPRVFFDTCAEMSIKEREEMNAKIEKVNDDAYVLRDMEEDGMKFDMWFINGGNYWTNAPVFKGE
jgi:hypothetical protein